jgi:hypothetical protein
VAYEYYGKILLPFYILLHTNIQHSEIHEEFISENIRYILFPMKKNRFEIPQTEIKHLRTYMDIPLMIEKVSHFKECGDKIVSRLLKSIEDIEKSDEEIIDLI